MSDYQVIARKFRPQSFQDVLGQEAIITTLKNAIRYNRLAHAYLFCGSRGTGKTTLARILAKALNCENLSEQMEPCNLCSSCKEITQGSSLDVIEIDGASNRGIDDIRQINDTVGYTSSGRYKVYIIDEVHMLTKDAFNALLKTLEEPPSHVKFLFATTEAHKVLPTIISRCQRFQLNRIPLEKIAQKLTSITSQLKIEVEQEAIDLIAQRAEGGLRDAESLLDQIIAFEQEKISVASVESVLGLMPRSIYFLIDQAGHVGDFSKAFEIVESVFLEGKNFHYFIEGLIAHLRQILLLKIGAPSAPISVKEQEQWKQSVEFYTQEQCLDLIDYLLEAQEKIRFSSFSKISLEAILLHVMRSHFRIPIELLVRRLAELEKSLEHFSPPSIPSNPSSVVTVPVSIPPPAVLEKKMSPPLKEIPKADVQEDPTPTAADLGKRVSKEKKEEKVPIKSSSDVLKRPVYAYDTLFQFASVELEGKIQKN